MLKIETTSKARIGMAKVTKTLSIETNPDVMRKQRNYIFDNFSASSAHVKFSSITDILDEKNVTTGSRLTCCEATASVC
jgi:hypothetical protein